MIQKIIKEVNKKQPLLHNTNKKSEILKKKWKNNFKKRKMKNLILLMQSKMMSISIKKFLNR